MTTGRFPPSMATEDWEKEHRPHLAAVNQKGDSYENFATKPFPHPSGTWFWQVCPCGAEHLRDDARPEAK